MSDILQMEQAPQNHPVVIVVDVGAPWVQHPRKRLRKLIKVDFCCVLLEISGRVW